MKEGGTMGNRFKIVSKMPYSNIIEIYIVINGNSRRIAVLETPNDKQISENVELSETVCAAIQKRIRKSV